MRRTSSSNLNCKSQTTSTSQHQRTRASSTNRKENLTRDWHKNNLAEIRSSYFEENTETLIGWKRNRIEPSPINPKFTGKHEALKSPVDLAETDYSRNI